MCDFRLDNTSTRIFFFSFAMRTPPSLRQAPACCTPFLPQPARRASLVRQVHVLIPARTLLDAHAGKYLFHLALVHTCGPWWRPPMSCQPFSPPLFLNSPSVFSSLFTCACIIQFPLRQLGPMGACQKRETYHFPPPTPCLTHVGQSTAATLVLPSNPRPGFHSLLFRLRRSAVSRCNSR